MRILFTNESDFLQAQQILRDDNNQSASVAHDQLVDEPVFLSHHKHNLSTIFATDAINQFNTDDTVPNWRDNLDDPSKSQAVLKETLADAQDHLIHDPLTNNHGLQVFTHEDDESHVIIPNLQDGTADTSSGSSLLTRHYQLLILRLLNPNYQP